MTAELASITVEYSIDDEEATYEHDGGTYPVVRLHWDGGPGLSTTVTAFGATKDPGCQMWVKRLEHEWRNLPDWVPDPPEWFWDAIGEGSAS